MGIYYINGALSKLNFYALYMHVSCQNSKIRCILPFSSAKTTFPICILGNNFLIMTSLEKKMCRLNQDMFQISAQNQRGL